MSLKPLYFILASASPRRKQLLEQANLSFRVVPSDVDESKYSSVNITSADFAAALALAKAKKIAADFPDFLVVGADTVVDYNGHIIGKPVDAADAEQIIRKLFSSPHKVITALAFVRLKDNTEIVKTDTTIVYPKMMSDEQIADHIEGLSWQGKAGAYGIQETGDEFVEKIEGSFTNVMGMPMELFLRILKKVGR